jgi:FkbM family methyltransferase
MVEAGGFLWTAAGAKWCASALLRDVADIERWLAYPIRRRECVQAGANVGVYPKALAAHFETVYAVELDPDNFACLKANAMPANVRAFHGALGERAGKVGMHASLPISHYVEGSGDIPVVTIDDFGLTRCDLIALDVEGYELPALKGAEQTLERCRPVLVIETKGHGERYGYSDEDLAQWLQDRGYTYAETIGNDAVWA